MAKGKDYVGSLYTKSMVVKKGRDCMSQYMQGLCGRSKYGNMVVYKANLCDDLGETIAWPAAAPSLAWPRRRGVFVSFPLRFWA